jgi:hypothetical protein
MIDIVRDAADGPGVPGTPQALFGAETLPAPPVPAHLAGLLRPQGRAVLASRPLPASPYDLEHFLSEIEADPCMSGYAIVGFDGYGTNSWAAHYYLVDHGLALFIQLPWGGAYLEPGPARAEIADLFEWAASLQSKLQLVHQRQLMPEGRRLQVAASRFVCAGWRWLVDGADNAAVPWEPATGMKADVLSLVDGILAGKDVLSSR